ncbi:MAG: heavy metal translocating P-type ATPase [Anaerolineales bacterium]
MEEKSYRWRVKGLDCPDCALSLEKSLERLPEVSSAELDFENSVLTIVSAVNGEGTAVVEERAGAMGYQLVPWQDEGDASAPVDSGWLRGHGEEARIVAAALLIMTALVLGFLRLSSLIPNSLYVAAILIAGLPIARSAWFAVMRAHNVDMNVLMTIAAVGAVIIGEFAEGAITVVLFSVGELLEGYSADRARNAIRGLMDLAPDEAALLKEGGERRVPVTMLEVGDRILVRPGTRIPMDGRVMEGRSAVNEAPVTGESRAIQKGPGDKVFAGTLNGSAALTVEVIRRAEESTIARIMYMVEEAQSQRAPAQRFVDRFARVYTPAVALLAAGVAFLPPLLGWGGLMEWVYRALVMLVIACPCALVISTPVTLVSALARGARAGVLIKGGRYLEQLASVRAVAFDKTGTLTAGEPQVVGGACEMHPDRDASCEVCQTLLAKAAAVEGRSEHRLAEAVVEYAQEMGQDARYEAVRDAQAIPGMGIAGEVGGHGIMVGSHKMCHPDDEPERALCVQIAEAERQGNTVLVIRDTCCDEWCYLTVSDRLRDKAPDAIRALKGMGVEHVVMLTGDNRFIAEEVAERIGVDEVHAGLMPEEKLRILKDLEERYDRVVMVGDGINDAPSLAQASVGIAMGAAGTDVALETADVALMGDDLRGVPFALGLGRKALRIVRFNIAFSLLIKLLFLGLAVAGISALWMAVLADTGATLLVSLNGLRMLRFGRRQVGAA